MILSQFIYPIGDTPGIRYHAIYLDYTDLGPEKRSPLGFKKEEIKNGHGPDNQDHSR